MNFDICGDLPPNLTRRDEIVALGPVLREEAARGCDCLNTSYFLVHQVMTTAFADDPHLTTSAALASQLSGRLNAKLPARAAARG
jgi:hypothetical protein